MADKGHGTSRKQAVGRKSRSGLPWLVVAAIAGVGLVIAGLALFALDRVPAPPAAADRPAPAVSGAPRVGQPLGDLALADITGKQVRLSDYAGRPVLINAWATWCPPCRAEMPDLDALHQRHQAEGFAVLAINAGEDAAIVDSFVKQGGFGFPVLLDPRMDTLDNLAIRSFPTSIVVGADGEVKLIQVGMLTPDAIRTVVEPLITQ